MIEITENELDVFALCCVRWLIRSKNYQTGKYIKIIKKYYKNLSKDTQKIIRGEIQGRLKQLNHSHKTPEILHYFNAYSDLSIFMNETMQGKK